MTATATALTPPRPFPYDTHPLNQFGMASWLCLSSESRHVSIGQDGWIPFAYALALGQYREGPTSALARYLEMAKVWDGLGALCDARYPSAEDKARWHIRFQADIELLKAAQLPFDETGAQAALLEMLFALCPPHRGIILECSREAAEWAHLPEHAAYRETLLTRYAWLLSQVSASFQKAGFEVRDRVFKLDGFSALLYDDFDAFSF